MTSSTTDTAFWGSVPALYHRYLGPLLFQPYAVDLARRVSEAQPQRVLETAAGTGIVTEAIREQAPNAEVVATDLNQAMLDIAAERFPAGEVRFQEADAQCLPFPNASFDLVVCQFGVMFFPDRLRAYREALRVLRPSGTFIFNVWDKIENNPVGATVAAAVAKCFPDNPPGFLQRTPFGYNDKAGIKRELRAAGFNHVQAETVVKWSCRPAHEAAIGLCHGTPLRSEIEERDASRLKEVSDVAAAALVAVGEAGEVDAPMSAHVFTARE